MSKKINFIVYTIVGLVVAMILLYKFLPPEIIRKCFGDNSKISQIFCHQTINIVGDSMEPFLKKDDRAVFNKCFEMNDLEPNMVVMFKDEGINRIAIIELINDGTLTLSQPNRQNYLIENIYIDQIVSIYDKKVSEEITNSNNNWFSANEEEFYIRLPKGWELVSKNNDSFVYANQAESGFQTYFTLTKDQQSGRDLQEYLDFLKSEIKNQAPNIIFSHEELTQIEQYDALVIEGDLIEKGINYKILFVGIQKNKNDIWIFSFNSLAKNWYQNDDIFVEILGSFSLK